MVVEMNNAVRNIRVKVNMVAYANRQEDFVIFVLGRVVENMSSVDSFEA